jgi:hypothetical protein
VGRYDRNRCRIHGPERRLLAELAPHIMLDGSRGGAIAFRDKGQLSIARWHRPEDCERAINRALEILVDGDECERESDQNDQCPAN